MAPVLEVILNMTVTYMDVSGSFGASCPLWKLERTRDGLASYCEARWPVGRRKSVAKEWALSADEARSVCEGSASQATLDKVWRHPRGGWGVLLPVMGAVIGQPIHDFFREQMRQAAREAARAQHHEKLAEAAWTRLESRSAALGEDRPSRAKAGTLGSEEAGSVERLSGEGR